MTKSKKFVSILLAVVMMFTLSCVGAFASDTEPTVPEDAQKMTYMGEIDGVKYWEATIPLAYTTEDGIMPMDGANVCEVTAWYDDYTLYCKVKYSVVDALLVLKGKCVTYGAICDYAEASFEAIGPSPVLAYTVTFDREYYNRRGNQYFDVDGNVEGLNGSGTFGPVHRTLYVEY